MKSFYLFEKKIIRTFHYKIYVDGHRLCFAKIKFLEKDDGGFLSYILFTSDWIGLIIGIVLAPLIDQRAQKRFKRQMDERFQTEQQYDEWSINEMEKLLGLKDNFAIDLQEIEKVVMIPYSQYGSDRGLIRFIFRNDQERSFFVIRGNKPERIAEILREAYPDLLIENRQF